MRLFLPVVQLPENHVIISSLLTFLFPVPPILPPREQILELLAVAQKYQASTPLARIRDCVAKLEPKFICSETALQVYSLAWEYGLREEALLAAEETLKGPMTLRVYNGKLNGISSAGLVELWKYRGRVIDNVNGNLGTDYCCRDTDVYKILLDFDCKSVNDSGIPLWLCNYLDSILKGSACLDITTFYLTVCSHITYGCQKCQPFPGKTTRELWDALAAVFNESIRRVSSTATSNAIRGGSHPDYPQAGMSFSVTRRETPSQSSTSAKAGAQPLLKGLNMLGADVILQSSDLVSFRVHMSTLAISSPFFNDLFSLPQPSDGEAVDGLPVVHVSEDAETLYSLITLLYPIPSVMPASYDKTLDLLAASEKYSMDIVLSTVRGKMILPDTEASFRAYAMASSKQLIPEMEAAARVTLDCPMTFERIMDDLLFFEGSALQDLLNFRQRCHDNLLSFFVNSVQCKDTLLKFYHKNKCSSIPHYSDDIPEWFRQLVSQHIENLQGRYPCPLPNSSTLRNEFNKAIHAHISGRRCDPCSNLPDALRDKWLRGVTRVRDQVRITCSPPWNCRVHTLRRCPSILTPNHQTHPKVQKTISSGTGHDAAFMRSLFYKVNFKK